MRITKQMLRQLIREEITRTLLTEDVEHWIVGPAGLTSASGDELATNGADFAVQVNPHNPDQLWVGLRPGTGQESWLTDYPINKEELQNHRPNPSFRPVQDVTIPIRY